MLASVVFGVIFIFFTIAVIAVGVAAAYGGRNREQAMQSLAAKLGVDFHPYGVGGPSVHATFFERLFARTGSGKPQPFDDVFDKGHSQRVFNVFHGNINVDGSPRELWAGDFRYKTGGGKNQSTHHFSYVILPTPEVGPRVWVRPENLLDAAAATLGFNDLDFESVAFSDAFHVKADDERYAYDLFAPPLIEFFLQHCPPHVRFGDGWLVLHDGNRWTPQQFEQYVAIAARISTLWPRHLLAEVRR
jgi:hypothetical protein